MIKTIIFGAGAGGLNFMENEKNNRIFLACADNDYKKHGFKLNLINIIHPNKIRIFNFDEIVITTQWAKPVFKQLTDELYISPDKIVIPSKMLLTKLKPFEDQSTREFAKTIISIFQEQAILFKIPLLLDFGTLLGIVRDNNVISWDDDIDFGINFNFKDSLEPLIFCSLSKISQNINWHIIKQFNNENQIIAYEIHFEETSFLRNFVTTINFRKKINDKSIHLISLGKWFCPAEHFEDFEILKWNGKKVQVPKYFERYLSFVYGEWKKPKKDITAEDYLNLNEVSFEEFNRANFRREKYMLKDLK